MAEKEVDSGSEHSSQESGGARLNPENGSTGLAALFRRSVEAALRENPGVIGDCLVFQLKAKNLKSLEFVMDMVMRWESNEEVSAGHYQSLAEMLMKACEEQGIEVAG
jgi:hypothetical protein